MKGKTWKAQNSMIPNLDIELLEKASGPDMHNW